MPERTMTELLQAWRGGDEGAHQELIRRAYPELKKIARSFLRKHRSGSVDPTHLVHEAYARLAPQDVDWESRHHFFALVTLMMRRAMVDHVRAQRRRGVNVTLAEEHAVEDAGFDLIELDLALSRMEEIYPFESQVVNLRFFGGLTIAETAEHLGVGHATVERGWKLARGWLYRRLRSEERSDR